MTTEEKIEVLRETKRNLKPKACFGRLSKEIEGKDKGTIKLTEEQAALIHAEFTPEGRRFFGDLYSGIHKDIFGDVAKMRKTVITGMAKSA